MEVTNRDMFPSQETRLRFSSIEALLDNPIFDDAFKSHELKAVKAKRIYHGVGRLGVFLIAISSIYTMAEALVLPASPWSQLSNLTFAAMALIGIILQAYITVTNQKGKWLVNRFACERIRSLKFQSFHLADEVKDQAALRKVIDAFSSRHLSRLQNDINAGLSFLERFNATKALDTPEHFQNKDVDEEMSKSAREAFEELRVRYQINFASSEVARLRNRLRSVTSLQDVMYFSAIALAIFSLAVKLFDTQITVPTNMIDFLAVSLFVSGAAKTITDKALLQEQSQGRYEAYIANLEHVSLKAKTESASLDELVDLIERVALNQLESFCQDALHVRYGF